MVPTVKFKKIRLLSQSWLMSAIPENRGGKGQRKTTDLLRTRFLSQEQKNLCGLTIYHIDFLSVHIGTDMACLM